MNCLRITVHFHDACYHGVPDWPPAPARLFQALVAAAARGDQILEAEMAALCWLEAVAAPEIVAPAACPGQAFRNYVPNNDLDAVAGNPARVVDIREAKSIRPMLFRGQPSLVYQWRFAAAAKKDSETIISLCRGVYQLGRGVDMAWARGDLLDDAAMPAIGEGQRLYRPTPGAGRLVLDCPGPGSLQSLQERYRAMRNRFVRDGKAVTLRNPPRPRFRSVGYGSPPARYLFELRHGGGDRGFAPWPLPSATELVCLVRDLATQRLSNALPGKADLIRRVLVGRKQAGEADTAERVKIVPLPSIGHPHADLDIRRVLVEIPPFQARIGAEDLRWAFSGLGENDPVTGEVLWELVPAEDQGFLLSHYAPAGGAKVWRTLTPAVLPWLQSVHRAPGGARSLHEGALAAAATQALRHAGVTASSESIRVQREPFDVHGTMAREFKAGRFDSPRLYHIEVLFHEPVADLLAIGDGRYLGLGVMAPRRQTYRGVACFDLQPPTPDGARSGVLVAVRRALMSLAKDGQGRVSKLFSGHEPNGARSASGHHEHVFLAMIRDGGGSVLLVAAPWAADRSHVPGQVEAEDFDRVVGQLREVRAGALGILHLDPWVRGSDGIYLGPATTWRSHTPYLVTRHGRRREPVVTTVATDVVAECRRRGLPQPGVEVHGAQAGERGGHCRAVVTLRFAVAIEGPILLGRDSHVGGGLFLPSSGSPAGR